MLEEKGDSSNIIEIDGSALEGGGQILRIASAMCLLIHKPVRISKIRAGRGTQGLRPQHLEGLKLLSRLCGGQLSGGEVGSTQVTLSPGAIEGGQFTAEIGTAGSVCLLMQSVIPCALFAKKTTNLVLRGGTNAEFAPHIDYMLNVLQPTLERFGANFKCEIIRRGYFPKGGGEVRVVINPVHKLNAISMVDKGLLSKIEGRAWVAGGLNIQMAYAMGNAADALLKSVPEWENVEKKPEIESIYPLKESEYDAIGNGSGVNIVASTNNGYLFGSDGLGKRGIKSEDVGRNAAQILIDTLKSDACVDQHLQDQLIIFMGLAHGNSEMRTGPVTLHTKTAILMVENITGVKFKVEESGKSSLISVQGIGLINENI